MPRNTSTTTPLSWRRTVLQYIGDHPARPLKPRRLARELGISGPDYSTFRTLLREMVSSGDLVLGPGRTLALPQHTGNLVGTFRAHRRGFGFIERASQPDLYVPRGRTGGALEGDRVTARFLSPTRRGADRPRAEVVRVIERAPLRWIGLLERRARRWLVLPHGKAPNPPVQIDDPTATNARPGDLVVVEPLEHTLGTRDVRGVIVERLGPPDDTQVKILAALRRYSIPQSFSSEARRAAQRSAARLNEGSFSGRQDLRGLLTITIDPADARDFDDAISIEPLPDDQTRLGVHIADVAHFVRAGSPLDNEARLRGNSVYFPGYVVPMLPEVLSNGVCSLQPGEPRLTKSVFLTYDNRGRGTDAKFCNSVIQSACRLTYAQATAVLADKPAEFASDIVNLLKAAEHLARRVQSRRLADGMLVLTLPEVDIRLGPDGRIVDARPADTSFSHTIIEMFMVAANEAVCRLLTRENLPHLRRIHPEPEPAAARSSSQLVGVLGRKLPRTLDRDSIRALLEAVRGQPEETAINYFLLRSLAPASYSPATIGHFALASSAYCHFTSPIRRYPDLVAHRVLDRYLRAQTPGSRTRRAAQLESEPDLVDLGLHTSQTERRAMRAEREVKTLLLLELMATKLGEVVDGIITGVARFGAFVQVHPYLAEGVIPVADFGPDLWTYNETGAAFAGQHSGHVVSIGQPVRVVVAAVDLFRQELTLVPADGGPIGVRRRGAKPSRARERRGPGRGWR
ncbi:MAG: ribonuclease R [Planctomycetes bacterium]|nr:ribonuclease R [Planctomycetota bacterium]